ncbi:hypothetical protein EP47_04885 [Legionella norrlandica]|uniref:Flagellar protein FlgJ N-terminal domain-containing protein n=1 Tax=Legionella norrlandica TaxID=1498499 RepID=A0A0A2SVD8_9GAMM|nr:rod-binding protein [Legionella norrlandica]KGP63701.1 hypothetical protein EP47_04885 [Legionella norrlandica]
MTDTLTLDTNNYLNIQGISNLKNRIASHSTTTQHEVAQQFESILVQMLLKSMRDANKVFSNNEESAAGHEIYQDLFDKQVALSIAHQGLGFSNAVERYLQQIQAPEQDDIQKNTQVSAIDSLSNAQIAKKPFQETTVHTFSTELEFVKSLWLMLKMQRVS